MVLNASNLSNANPAQSRTSDDDRSEKSIVEHLDPIFATPVPVRGNIPHTSGPDDQPGPAALVWDASKESYGGCGGCEPLCVRVAAERSGGDD